MQIGDAHADPRTEIAAFGGSGSVRGAGCGAGLRLGLRLGLRGPWGAGGGVRSSTYALYRNWSITLCDSTALTTL